MCYMYVSKYRLGTKPSFDFNVYIKQFQIFRNIVYDKSYELML